MVRISTLGGQGSVPMPATLPNPLILPSLLSSFPFPEIGLDSGKPESAVSLCALAVGFSGLSLVRLWPAGLRESQ